MIECGRTGGIQKRVDINRTGHSSKDGDADQKISRHTHGKAVSRVGNPVGVLNMKKIRMTNMSGEGR